MKPRPLHFQFLPLKIMKNSGSVLALVEASPKFTSYQELYFHPFRYDSTPHINTNRFHKTITKLLLLNVSINPRRSSYNFEQC